MRDLLFCPLIASLRARGLRRRARGMGRVCFILAQSLGASVAVWRCLNICGFCNFKVAGPCFALRDCFTCATMSVSGSKKSGDRGGYQAVRRDCAPRGFFVASGG